MTPEVGPERPPIAHDLKIFLLTLAAGFPAVVIAMVFVWNGNLSAKVEWTLTIIALGSWVGVSVAVRDQVVRPLQTISNMLAALHEGDYSIRARRHRDDDALGLAMLEANTLGETLRKQRLDAVEAAALLAKVMEEIDVAVFAFDGNRTLKLVNRGGERLLQRGDNLLGRTADELGLAHCLTGPAHRILDASFAGHMGRWELRRSRFREGGLPHQLLVLSDLTRALRQEERQAWQRLIQVLRHEINNSLAPIRSLAGTMGRIIMREPQPPDWKDDLQKGLSVISERSGALSRFMSSYTQLTRLPEPQFKTVDVGAWIQRVAKLETRLPVRVVPGPSIEVHADGDQLDQLLINIVRNAVDAALETGGGVSVGWMHDQRDGDNLDVWIQDDGPGLSNTDNLFVPFFTTKPRGSGIGLVLSRQIAEAHGGTLTLENRSDATGCEAHVRLPIRQAA